MTRIKVKSETSLLNEFEQELRMMLPAGWQIEAKGREIRPVGRRSFMRADLVLTVEALDGAKGAFLVEAKSQRASRDIHSAAAQLDSLAEALKDAYPHPIARVLVSDYLSPRARDMLLERNIGWYDATGNIRLELGAPAVFISKSGAERDPHPRTADRRLKSLKGPGAARVVRALLDNPPDTRVRPLAEHAGVGTATSARVLQYLAQEQLVERDEHAAVQRVRKRSLAYAWARDYGLTTTNHTITVLAPRGIDWVVEQLAERHLPHVLTGSAALRQYLAEGASAVTPLSLLAVYSEEVPVLQRELRLRSTERGANVLLLEPFDQAVLQRAQEVDGHRYSAPSQTVVDLLTSPGRGSEEAEQLIEVLAENDEEWTL
ncbi:hypothetical protein L0U85_07535 [Glycomyces sp. L485]|uniref:hypothetical protein n=1 Tax=Glycomyces sp. L485 TaxID=2909235 RepID=UPI001F4A6374|nr:hypothetical protein [Glycomyces sp. L485]MCH7230701.1 hypothetical protein [Glycomyces sp. L485]